MEDLLKLQLSQVKQQLVDLINNDYQQFIQLSVDLQVAEPFINSLIGLLDEVLVTVVDERKRYHSDLNELENLLHKKISLNAKRSGQIQFKVECNKDVDICNLVFGDRALALDELDEFCIRLESDFDRTVEDFKNSFKKKYNDGDLCDNIRKFVAIIDKQVLKPCKGQLIAQQRDFYLKVLEHLLSLFNDDEFSATNVNFYQNFNRHFDMCRYLEQITDASVAIIKAHLSRFNVHFFFSLLAQQYSQSILTLTDISTFQIHLSDLFSSFIPSIGYKYYKLFYQSCLWLDQFYANTTLNENPLEILSSLFNNLYFMSHILFNHRKRSEEFIRIHLFAFDHSFPRMLDTVQGLCQSLSTQIGKQCCEQVKSVRNIPVILKRNGTIDIQSFFTPLSMLEIHIDSNYSNSRLPLHLNHAKLLSEVRANVIQEIKSNFQRNIQDLSSQMDSLKRLRRANVNDEDDQVSAYIARLTLEFDDMCAKMI